MIVLDENEQPYWNPGEDIFFPITVDADGDAVFQDDFGAVRVVASATDLAEAAALENVNPAWTEAASDSVNGLEHRLNREMTEAEKDTVITDMAKSGTPDAIEPYVAHYPEGRSRRELAAEVVQDSWDAAAQEEDTEPEPAEGATPREQLINAVEDSRADSEEAETA